MSYNDIKLQISSEIEKILEERHILEDEIKQVIHHAETDGDKLYLPDTNTFLSKLRIGNATFYVKYSVEDDSYPVLSAYAHKSEILG